MSEYTIPGGKNKGTPISEASDQDLNYWAEVFGEELDKGKVEEKFIDSSTKRYKAFLAELENRGHAQQELPQTKPAAQKEAEKQPDKVEQQSVPEQKAEMVVHSATELTGTFRDYKDIADRFAQAAKHFHFISPATSCPKLPEGCSIAMSAITVDQENETYYVGGVGDDAKYGLSKSVLQKISLAAGVKWIVEQCGRTDDRSNPHYCSWTMVGKMRLFDGTEVPLPDSKEMDLRDGSAQLQALYERYEAAKKKDPKKAKDPTNQIREMRLHIAAHAETKAMLRTIRALLGVRTSYTKKELEKPFIVARLMWTGETDNPALQEKFSLMQARMMLGAEQSLYGNASIAAPQLPKNAPPRLGTVPVDAEDMGDDY